MDDREKIIAGRELINIINKFSEVINLQLVGARETIGSAVEDVMNQVTDLSAATSKESKEAERVLESTYFRPENETKDLMDIVQNSVDQLMTQIQADSGEGLKDDNAVFVDNRIRRLVGQFSKHMEALSSMDGAIAKILMNIVAAMSNDDVIGQRLQHILHAVHGLEVGLSYVLLDFQDRFTVEEVRKIKNDLLLYTYNNYTMEEEKAVFRKIFKNPPTTLQSNVTNFKPGK